MRFARRKYPLRGYHCAMAVSRRRTYLAVGDIMSIIPTAPWLPKMATTPLKVIGHQRFVDSGHARAWVPALRDQASKESSVGLEKLLDWADEISQTIGDFS